MMVGSTEVGGGPGGGACGMVVCGGARINDGVQANAMASRDGATEGVRVLCEGGVWWH